MGSDSGRVSPSWGDNWRSVQVVEVWEKTRLFCMVLPKSQVPAKTALPSPARAAAHNTIHTVARYTLPSHWLLPLVAVSTGAGALSFHVLKSLAYSHA